MLHTITKRLEKCCDIDTEVELLLESLEITFFLNKHFFLQMAYELLSQSRKLNKLGGGGGGGGVLIRGGMIQDVSDSMIPHLELFSIIIHRYYD